jgi:hypothetical protein
MLSHFFFMGQFMGFRGSLGPSHETMLGSFSLDVSSPFFSESEPEPSRVTGSESSGTMVAASKSELVSDTPFSRSTSERSGFWSTNASLGDGELSAMVVTNLVTRCRQPPGIWNESWLTGVSDGLEEQKRCHRLSISSLGVGNAL